MAVAVIQNVGHFKFVPLSVHISVKRTKYIENGPMESKVSIGPLFSGLC